MRAKVKIVRDKVVQIKRVQIQFLIFFDSQHSIGICDVEVEPHQKAEVLDIQIFGPYRRKGYGSQLWRFAENYIIRKYHPKQFFAELNPESYPESIKFWKSQNFDIKSKTRNLSFAIKRIYDKTGQRGLCQCCPKNGIFGG